MNKKNPNQCCPKFDPKPWQEKTHLWENKLFIKDTFLWLSYDPSPWKSEHYIAVTKQVPNAENVKLSGTFMSKVFDGPFNAVPKWIKEMEGYLTTKGKKAKKYYFYFTTCPKCAKKYGHNYVVTFAQIE